MSYRDRDHVDSVNDQRAEHNHEHGENLSLPEFLRLLLTNRVPDPRQPVTQPGGGRVDDKKDSPPATVRPAHLHLINPE